MVLVDHGAGGEGITLCGGIWVVLLCGVRGRWFDWYDLRTGMGLTAESRITPKRAITSRAAVRHAGDESNESYEAREV